MLDLNRLTSTLSWTTRQELQFLEDLLARQLACPPGAPLVNQHNALRNYADGFRLRTKWSGIDKDVVARWLIAHGLGGVLLQPSLPSPLPGRGVI